MIQARIVTGDGASTLEVLTTLFEHAGEVPALPMPLEPDRLLEPLCPVEP